MTNHRPLVYLACPYTHNDPIIENMRFLAANKAAAKLIIQGEFVYSPISMAHPIAVDYNLPSSWEFWEGYDRAVISCCYKLIVLRLEGWETSTGVTAEIKIAEEMGIPVEYIDDDDKTD